MGGIFGICFFHILFIQKWSFEYGPNDKDDKDTAFKYAYKTIEKSKYSNKEVELLLMDQNRHEELGWLFHFRFNEKKQSNRLWCNCEIFFK